MKVYCLLLVFFLMHHHIEAGTYEGNSNFATVSGPRIRKRKILSFDYQFSSIEEFASTSFLFSCQDKGNCKPDF